MSQNSKQKSVGCTAGSKKNREMSAGKVLERQSLSSSPSKLEGISKHFGFLIKTPEGPHFSKDNTPRLKGVSLQLKAESK